MLDLVLLSRVVCRGQVVTSARIRALLALLAADLPAGSSSSRLIDGLWPDGQPEKPLKALQVLVSRARTQFGADLIASTPTGYRLTLAPERVDSSAVLLAAASAASEANTGHPEAALQQAVAGLRHWEQAEDNSAPNDPVAMLRAARDGTRQALVRLRALSRARLGEYSQALVELGELSREHPLDEEVLVELLTAEAATVGPAAALHRYEAYRRRLRNEMGADPGAPLQDCYQRLLAGSAPLIRHGLRYEPNPLLGREHDVLAVSKLLRTARVTSIIGPGGLGKTRLAQLLARQAEQPVVYVVGLSGVSADADVLSELAAALQIGRVPTSAGRRPTGRAGVLEAMGAALGPGPALLVLDNCEHVIGEVADLVQVLVGSIPNLRVLTTSRSPLGLSSESIYLLPELDLDSAVELFRQRARAIRPGVELATEAVQQVCRQLDGLPLAVELAAARVRVMSVTEIARALEDRFAVLRGGARDTPQRHRTLEAVVEWSWNLLDPSSQAGLVALAVFPDGFTAEAAEHVIGVRTTAAEGASGLRMVELLVDHSLLKVVENSTGTRFRMLETVRQFCSTRTVPGTDPAAARAGFLDWVVGFARTEHDSLFGADPFSAAPRIRAELENLVHALRLGLERVDGRVVAATAAVLGALWTFESNYRRMGLLAEESTAVLARFRPDPDLVEVTRTALILNVVHAFLIEKSRSMRATAALRRLPPAAPDTVTRAADELVRRAVRDPQVVHELCDSDAPILAGIANSVASYLRDGQGDADRSLQATRRSLRTFEACRLPWLQMLAHGRLSELYLQAEQGAQAQAHLRVALVICEQIGTRADVIGLRWWMVLAQLQTGELDEAEMLLRATPRRATEVPALFRSYGLGVEAEIALARGDVSKGLSLWRAAVDELSRRNGPSGCEEDDIGLEDWSLEARSMAVIAHAHHGRLGLVAGIADELPGLLVIRLRQPNPGSGVIITEKPICGAGLLALAMVELDRATRTGDLRAREAAARDLALAECFGWFRGFQPTMSSARARQVAQGVDSQVYTVTKAAWGGRSWADLRAFALARMESR